MKPIAPWTWWAIEATVPAASLARALALAMASDRRLGRDTRARGGTRRRLRRRACGRDLTRGDRELLLDGLEAGYRAAELNALAGVPYRRAKRRLERSGQQLRARQRGPQPQLMAEDRAVGLGDGIAADDAVDHHGVTRFAGEVAAGSDPVAVDQHDATRREHGDAAPRELAHGTPVSVPRGSAIRRRCARCPRRVRPRPAAPRAAG